jgi:hypothetical protein
MHADYLEMGKPIREARRGGKMCADLEYALNGAHFRTNPWNPMP